MDEFRIPINNQENTNSMFGPPTTYSGTCGRNTAIVASIKVTQDAIDPPAETDLPTTCESSSLVLRSVAFTVAIGVVAGVAFRVT